MPPQKFLVASSNPGKLAEFRALAAGQPVDLDLIPDFASHPAFDESAPTFAENAAGKALHYSGFVAEAVIADDSGLVVPALGGAPGPKSARYAGPEATDAERVHKLLEELRGASGGGGRSASAAAPAERRAHFVCVLALAQAGKLLAVFSDYVEGILLDEPRGQAGFGYDPIFFYEPFGKTFAELTREEKNQVSHRGRAFRKLLRFLETGTL
jgi:XTP/dITP diphosphohydrolase